MANKYLEKNLNKREKKKRNKGKGKYLEKLRVSYISGTRHGGKMCPSDIFDHKFYRINKMLKC